MREKILSAGLALVVAIGGMAIGGGPASAATGSAPSISLRNPSPLFLDVLQLGDTGRDAEADYRCSDVDGDLVSCAGDVPDGTPVDTSTLGLHTFTVTATDAGGNVTVETAEYLVSDATVHCQATAARIGASAQSTANPSGVGCPTEDVVGTALPPTTIGVPGVPPLPLLPFGISVTVEGYGLRAKTQRPLAQAEVAHVRISLPSGILLGLTDIRSTASTYVAGPDCQAGFTARSALAVQIANNGSLAGPFETPYVTDPMTIPLGIGDLHLNQQVIEGRTVVQRAVVLDLPGTDSDVVLGEARAGISCPSSP